MLAHRGNHRMVDTAQVPKRVEHFAALVEFDDASGIDIREQPFVDRNPLAHPLAEAGHFPCEINPRAAHAAYGQPIISVRGQIRIFGVAGRVVDNGLDFSVLRSTKPLALYTATNTFI